MRNALLSISRRLLGGQPAISVGVIAAAVATAVLQSSGADDWWVLPVVVIVVIGVGLGRRQP